MNTHEYMKTLHCIAFCLVVIGGLNWLLVGIFGSDVGLWLFGSMSAIASRAIYVLVGVAAIYEIVRHKSSCKMCSASSVPAASSTTSI